MATARIRLQAHVDGLLTGDLSVSLAWTLGAAVGKRETLSLAVGDNTITVPTGTRVIILTPPAGNTQALKVLGATGQTMFTADPGLPMVLTYGTGTLIVNVGAGSNVSVEAVYL